MEIPETFNKKAIIKNTIFAVCAGLLGIGIVSIFTHNWNFKELLKSFSFPLLVLSFLMMIANWFIEAVTLKVISKSLEYKLSLKDALEVFLVGGFFSRITPFGGGGGEPVQMYVLAQSENIKPGDSAAIVAIKMFVGTFVRISVFLLIPAWVLIAKPAWNMTRTQNILINSGISLTIFLFLVLIAALFKPQIAEKAAFFVLRNKFLKKIFKEKQITKAVDSLKKTFSDFTEARKKIFKAKQRMIFDVFILSFMSWGLILLTPVVLMRGLGITSPLPEIIITAIIFYISSAYIPTPGGSGTSEIEILALFSRLIPGPLIGVFIITWRLFTHYFLLITGGIMTLFKLRKSNSNKKPLS